ncbi:flavin monoamine oxidase family protein [Phaeodactylibacter luteus]|uniref:FAD-dependent oxidoreductase n=1 Tax=Phaeodactylibacter luteus TaxID=1564516 RepID=A0A5C6RKJ9_9BACT|nr:NAD(P)/FAD-dependent oxidoreductase [Phaeodactylibacter luteus]TXB62908.1 FAD-dependent oxidoreductase [Phaeodactylibacter luteus]
MELKTDTLIIGAGLTGLTLAYWLQQSGRQACLLEARARPGGRVHTDYQAGQAPVELGATWFGNKHTALMSLLEELKLSSFPQELGRQAIYEPISTSPPQVVQLPPNEEPSYRIAGGSSALVQALLAQLNGTPVHYHMPVAKLARKGESIVAEAPGLRATAQRVVSTLPPHLLAKSITLQPGLPEEVAAIAARTHTWMGDSIKVAFRYKEAFWRKPGSSGTLFSNVGPIPEMYDHADADGGHFALKGFFNSAYHSISREERQEMALQQLSRYYGDAARSYTGYLEAVWQQEPYTFAPYNASVLPHQHNGHAIFRKPLWGGRLWIAGSETAPAFPGYMDGAVRSARFTFEAICQAPY